MFVLILYCCIILNIVSRKAYQGTLYLIPYYYSQAGKVSDAMRHYLREGFRLGLNPHPLFNTSYYTEQYPDVLASKTNPLVHFVTHGADQGRSPRADISSEIILALPVLFGEKRWQAL